MKRFVVFLKSPLLGGLIAVLPAWLGVLLVLKALAHLQISVKPIGSHLPRTPALVEIEEAVVPGFIVEHHSGNRSTVFIPSAPTPMAGAVYIIDNRRVHRLDIPAVAVMQCISKWGGGSDKLVAAYDAVSVRATS